MNHGASIKDMLVIVDLGGDRRPVAVAADLARSLGAHLTGLALAFDPIIPVYTVAAPIPTDFIVAAHEQGLADARASLAAFKAMTDAAGIPAEPRLAESVTGDGFAAIAGNAVLSDLVVVGQQNPDRVEPMREAVIEALLFQAGVPTLLIPYSGRPEMKFDRAVVAWNGSAAGGRAVRAALPLLAGTKEVLAVVVKEAKAGDEEPGADIGAYLARHGINVTVRTVTEAPTGIGATLLSFASDEEADYVVMGAYGHSRIREFLIGGVTRHILAHATLPVLMAH